MGSEDHLFLPSIKDIVANHVNASLHIIKQCGHVVNVEQPKEFNTKTIGFIQSLA
jgi:pimeloyl-ACP methyl ester carboxylesterase